jgi:hypothetical protein
MTINECTRFADEFGGQPIVFDDNNKLCAAIKMRNLEITIQGRSSKSPLVLSAFFSYEYETESKDEDALCLCQIPLTENEINLLVPILKSLDFKIDSLTSHWLKADPPIYYLNAHIVDDPTIYAINLSHIFSLLKL